jgi:TRAP-type C4-dicarboxylate transport system permease small subunit
MRRVNVIKLLTLVVSFGTPLLLSHTVLAATGNVGQVENFIRNIIQVVAGLAGLIATGFFVVGGFGYITSSGNPEHLDKSKRTLMYSAIGLAITIGAFVLSNIISEIASKAFGN